MNTVNCGMIVKFKDKKSKKVQKCEVLKDNFREETVVIKTIYRAYSKERRHFYNGG